MKEKNLDYLIRLTQEMGFEGPLWKEIERGLVSGQSRFQVVCETRLGETEVLAVLHFKKSASTDLYYFNRYELFMRPHHLPYEILQVFFVYKDQCIALKEAYNLLNGRAVWKERQGPASAYSYWLKLDFNQLDVYGNYRYRYFHPAYGFDLERVLDRFAIREWEDPPQRERLIRALRKGNQAWVHFYHRSVDRRYLIEANPQFKTLNIYDESRKRLYSRDFHQLEKKPGSKMESAEIPGSLVAEEEAPFKEEGSDGGEEDAGST